MPADLDTHYADVIKGLLRGKVTPVLGAGVNMCGRPPTKRGEWLGKYPPNGEELAEFLAAEFEYPRARNAPADLLQVSQYVYAVRGGSGPLYDQLHEIFDASFPTTPVHDFLALAPAGARDRVPPGKPPLVVTTNYDDLMETALVARGEEFDVLVYSAEGRNEGKFCLRATDGELVPITEPKTYVDIDPDRRTTLLKIHGFVDRDNSANDSYVITEDHYIEYLTRMDLDNLIPVKVLDRMRNCHFLFLGYSLRDWNLRAILYKLWTDRQMDRDWWAVQLNPNELEQQSWSRRGVKIFDVPLDDYLAGLSAHLQDSLAP
jgi:SIR2-like domain